MESADTDGTDAEGAELTDRQPAVARVSRYGTDAFLLHATNPDDVPNLLAAIDRHAVDHPALREAHAGEQSILVRFDLTATYPATEDTTTNDPASPVERTRHTEHTIAELLRRLQPLDSATTTRAVTLPVCYNGPDLAAVADATRLSVEAVVAMHQSATYRVAFCGFAPGFAYLTGLPEQLHVPRLDSPRNAVPQGSVAVAAHYCAVYPSQSPGGWLLIGTCDTRLFEPATTPPALLAPGTTVTFEAS